MEDLNIQLLENGSADAGLIEITEGWLLDTKAQIQTEKAISVPITALSSLGAVVSSLIPLLNTVTQTVTSGGQGLYRVANAEAGEHLRLNKKDNLFVGSIKKMDGSFKFAKFEEVGSISSTVQTVMPPNPAIMMAAVALFSIEQKLGEIEETQRKILSFLEAEKQAEIEADIETLVDMMKKYKMNWDNPQFLSSNHKMVLDIQRTARKNMNAYQKKVAELANSKQFVTAQVNVRAKEQELQRNFQYYRLSLYGFSLASLLEILFSSNYQEAYITGVKEEIRRLAETYRDLFERCSAYLEQMSASAIDSGVKKKLGAASRTVGKWIGSIPVISEGPVDEFLQDKGERLRDSAAATERKAVREFAAMGNPGTAVLEQQMDELNRIYNHTTELCFDNANIYLIAG